MFGLGTIINVTAIVAGGVMGLLFGKKLTERYQSNLMMASALCVLELHVAEGDMGKVIGKQGRIAKAIRTVVKASVDKGDKKIVVDIQ